MSNKRSKEDGWDESQNKVFKQLVDVISPTFLSDKAGSFTYIIGANGTGKSRQLARLAEHFAGNEKRPSLIGCVSNLISDRFNFFADPPIIYLGSRTVSNAVFLGDLNRQILRALLTAMQRRIGALSVLESALQMKFYFNVVGGQKVDLPIRMESLIDKRRVKDSSLRKKMTAEEYANLSSLFPFDAVLPVSNLIKKQVSALHTFLSFNPSIEIFVEKNGQSNKLDFSQLSSGEQNRILTFGKILSVARERALILIDEPETSLHLHWQMIFHKSLESVLKGIKCFHIVIATHSPTIISEAARSSKKGNVATLTMEADANAQPDTRIQLRKLSQIVSHEELVLNDFDTAPYNGKELLFETANHLLKAVENAQEKKASIHSLEQLREATGITVAEKRSVDDALTLLREGSLFLSTTAQEDDDAVTLQPN